MNAIKSVFSFGQTQSESGAENPGKVGIHPLSETPTRAWDKIKVKQVTEIGCSLVAFGSYRDFFIIQFLAGKPFHLSIVCILFISQCNF